MWPTSSFSSTSNTPTGFSCSNRSRNSSISSSCCCCWKQYCQHQQV
jgi:hypothetical protein